MTPTVGQALAKALDLEQQGCITGLALALITLANAFKDVVGEESFEQFLNEKDFHHDH